MINSKLKNNNLTLTVKYMFSLKFRFEKNQKLRSKIDNTRLIFFAFIYQMVSKHQVALKINSRTVY